VGSIHGFIHLFHAYLLAPVNNSIYIIAEMMMNMDNISQVHLLFEIKLEPVMFYHTISMDAPIFTSQGVAVTLVILFFLPLS